MDEATKIVTRLYSDTVFLFFFFPSCFFPFSIFNIFFKHSLRKYTYYLNFHEFGYEMWFWKNIEKVIQVKASRDWNVVEKQLL